MYTFINLHTKSILIIGNPAQTVKDLRAIIIIKNQKIKLISIPGHLKMNINNNQAEESYNETTNRILSAFYNQSPPQSFEYSKKSHEISPLKTLKNIALTKEEIWKIE